MASSFSITPPSFKHDVFLSFKLDTPDYFTSHLHRVLAGHRLAVCFGDENYAGVYDMRPFREKIKESRISVVIISKYYANSARCLNELVYILERKKVYNQIVIPVFYIEQSDVRNLTGSVADAFKKHEYDGYHDELLQRWRNALTEISTLEGFDSRNFPCISQLVQVVHGILKELEKVPPITPENAHSIIDIGEQNRGDEDNTTIHKITAERMFVVINFILEVPSAVFDQLSSLHKPQYVLLIMLMSFTTMLFCIVELVYKGGVERGGWRWREKIPWFYYPAQRQRPFGTVTDFIGLLCGIFQCMFAAVDYAFYLRNIDNPVKISVWPLIFAFCLLCSKLSKNPHTQMP